MSDSQDIRAWARAQDIPVRDRGRIPGDVTRQYEAAHESQQDGEAPAATVITLPEPGPAPGSPPEAGPPAPPPVPERPPQPPPRKRRFGQRKPPGDKPKHKRVSIENVVSSGWALGALALARSPRAIPVARILDMQAPVAGIIVEDIARNTLIDRILQPIARGGEKAEKAAALVGPPVLVGIITAQPGLFPALRPVLKMTMMSWMQVSAPAMRKAEERAAKWGEEFGDVDLDAMIDALWADLPEQAVPSEQEEANIRRARGE